MTAIRQPQPEPGDYYGIIYSGSLILPVLAMVALAVLLWWFLRKRRFQK